MSSFPKPLYPLNEIDENDIKNHLKGEIKFYNPSGKKTIANRSKDFCDYYDYYKQVTLAKQDPEIIKKEVDLLIKRIIKSWGNRVFEFNLKPSTKLYYKEQASFFSGALTTLSHIYGQEYVPAGLLICVTVGRNILKEYGVSNS